VVKSDLVRELKEKLSAQLERQMISDRTKNALQARKAKGLPMGRPAGVSKLDGLREVIMSYQDKGLNLTAISKLIDCNRQTLANWLEAQNSKF
jgi:putative DNA-invertase from lambdoid prophage Rac